MFMFRSRRTTLTKRLLRAHRRRCDETRRTLEDEQLNSMLKKLKDNQLELLLDAVESHGRDLSNCVLVPSYEEPPDGEPHVVSCQAWRWPDVRYSDLRRLPTCRSACDTVYVCCNPYHWSRLCKPVSESPPPPYSRCAMDRLKPEDRAPSEAPIVFHGTWPGSLTTNGEDSSSPKDWCKIAYWELTQRVGRLYPVELHSVNIFWDIPYGDGLSLKQLAQHSFSPPEEVRKTRRKIGLGITLSREDGAVWVYNRSGNPIFVSSLTLEDNDEGCPSSPARVPEEYCLCVFDPIKAARRTYGWNGGQPPGRVDHNCVTISFAKGWGWGYSRREVISCPCRIEILLAPCR